MSMRLTDICKAIAQEARLVVPNTAYPAPGAAHVATPLLVIFAGPGRLERGAGEQYLYHRIRGQFLAAPTDAPSALAEVDRQLEPLIDHFDPENRNAYHLYNFAEGKGVDFCEIAEWDFSKQITYANVEYLGGEVFWNVKVRRLRSDL